MDGVDCSEAPLARILLRYGRAHPAQVRSAADPGSSMSRYRKTPTRTETEIARLADKTKALRIELQGMVKRRRRSDLIDEPLTRNLTPDLKKPR